MRVQQSVTVGGIQLSYTDFGGSAPPALALHGSFGRGEIFSAIAHELRGTVRLIAPDQRGHGHSDRADTYTCAGFVADAAGLLERLDLRPSYSGTPPAVSPPFNSPPGVPTWCRR